MSNKTFLVDAEKCTGCKMCVVACKDEHVDHAYAPWTRPQPGTGQFWIDLKEIERGHTPRVRMSYLPMLCQHCANAPCIKACPENAIETRADGLVWINPAKCTGCGLCKEACPYDVIYMNADANIAQKCTGCAHRVDDGLAPRCVEVCPHDAILYADHSGSTGAVSLHPEFNAQPRAQWKGLPKPWIAGAVVDATDDEVVIGATVTAYDLFADGTTAAVTDAFGEFWLKGLAEGRKYRIEIAMPGYKSFQAVVTTDGDQDLGTVTLARDR